MKHCIQKLICEKEVLKIKLTALQKEEKSTDEIVRTLKKVRNKISQLVKADLESKMKKEDEKYQEENMHSIRSASRYVKVCYAKGAGIRTSPIYPGERSGDQVQPNAVVEYSEKITYQFNGHCITFYKLMDNRGWIHNYNPSNESSLDALKEVKMRYAIISYFWNNKFQMEELPIYLKPEEFWAKKSNLYCHVMFQSDDDCETWSIYKKYCVGKTSNIIGMRTDLLPKPKRSQTNFTIYR